jgi:integrase/recombinase XerD
VAWLSSGSGPAPAAEPDGTGAAPPGDGTAPSLARAGLPGAGTSRLHVRLGRDCAESTTEAYARSLGLLLDWCSATGLDWRQAPGHLGRFMYWVQCYDPDVPAVAQVRVVRGARRVNAVLAAVREFYRHAAAIGQADRAVLDALFDPVTDFDLPADVRGERAGLRLRGRPRHQLSEPDRVIDNASDEEVLAWLRACGTGSAPTST